MADIVICYATEDAGVAIWLDAMLAEHSYDVFYFQDLNVAYSDWQQRVFREIEKCACLVVLVAPGTDKSAAVRAEVEKAKACGKPIVPLQFGFSNKNDADRVPIESCFWTSRRPT